MSDEPVVLDYLKPAGDVRPPVIVWLAVSMTWLAGIAVGFAGLLLTVAGVLNVVATLVLLGLFLMSGAGLAAFGAWRAAIRRSAFWSILISGAAATAAVCAMTLSIFVAREDAPIIVVFVPLYVGSPAFVSIVIGRWSSRLRRERGITLLETLRSDLLASLR